MTFPEHGEVTDQDIGEKLNAMQCCRSWIFKFSYIKINDNLPPNTCLPLPPTAQVGKIPPERWVWGARCLPLPPTAQVGSTPYKGWAHLHGGHSLFSPQLKTNFAPPCPFLPPLLAVVTAMMSIGQWTLSNSMNYMNQTQHIILHASIYSGH